MGKTFPLALLAALLAFPAPAFARKLQIIHTNDLHSHFEHAAYPSEAQGNYAAVKYQIDLLKAQAQAQGIDTLILDAGDFSEATQFFLADQGAWSWKMMNSMGYDAVVLGNHDYLMGQDQLNDLIRRMPPTFNLLCANFEVWDDLPYLEKHLKPSVSVTKAGYKIGIIGVTTDDFEYQWRAGPLVIDPPAEVLDKNIVDLNNQNDFTIALTHVGDDVDRQLARQVPGLDLIVGGHTHVQLTSCDTTITEKDGLGHTVKKVVTMSPCQEQAPDGRMVPVVQAGQHGEVVGDLLVDLDPQKGLTVLHHHMIPVSASGDKAPDVETLVQQARSALDSQYGASWLHEVVAYSEIDMITPKAGPTTWGGIFADSMRETVGADLSIDEVDLFGDSHAKGPVTREDLFNLYPRVFGLDERYGWTIWRTEAYGWVLRFMIQEGIRYGLKFNLSTNVKYTVTGSPGKQNVEISEINGKPYRPLHSYRLALPEGIGRGAREIVDPIKLFLREAKDTRVPIWWAVEQKVRGLQFISGPEVLKLSPKFGAN